MMNTPENLKQILDSLLLASKQFQELQQFELENYFNALYSKMLTQPDRYDSKEFKDQTPALNNTQAALIEAFLHQDFKKANDLVKNGAILGSIERSAMELAFDSKAASQAGYTPKRAFPKTGDRPLHTMKEYGLVLGISATSQDGTYSQFAHIGPTYSMMRETANGYANNEEFKNIAEAFSFTDAQAKFKYSTSQNPQVGTALANRIQEGKITSIPISCRGHTMGLSVVPDQDGKGGYVVFTNRGEGADPKKHGTHIYRVDDLKKINPQFIDNMVNGHANGTPHKEIMRQFHEVTDHQKPVHSIKQKSQKNDNCSIANVRANMHGILLCQEAQKQNKPVEALSENDRKNVKKHQYKKFTSHMHGEKINKLSRAIREDPNNLDLRNLATQYIVQHPGDNKKKYKGILQDALSETATISNNKSVTKGYDHTKTNLKTQKGKSAAQNTAENSTARTSSKSPRSSS